MDFNRFGNQKSSLHSFLERYLNDNDQILRKAGIGIKKLYNTVISDSRVESNWNYRASSVFKKPYIIDSKNLKEKDEVLALVREELEKLDMEKVVYHILKSVAIGFSVFEIIWEEEHGLMKIKELKTLPSWWFDFDENNKLILKETREELDEINFLLVQHGASYENPYGERLFTKLYWQVVFKQNAFKWWASFVEKYASPFLYGVYPENSSDAERDELLYALDDLLSSSVGIGPDGSKLQIFDNVNKEGSSSAFLDFFNFINKEISIAILGQNLTTEVDGVGSYASGRIHKEVRDDISRKDKALVEKTFCKLIEKLIHINYKDKYPKNSVEFKFLDEYILNDSILERDKELFSMGIRFTKEYVIKNYQLAEGSFYFLNEQPNPTNDEKVKEDEEEIKKDTPKSFIKKLKEKLPQSKKVRKIANE